MKSFIQIFAVILFSLLTFFSSASAHNLRPKHTNYVILLDLSDRLLNANQAELDKLVIMEIFLKFEKQVKRNLYIRSEARFSIIILPQLGTKYDLNAFNSQLSIDLSSINMANRKKSMDKFSSDLLQTLSDLYEQACQGKKSSDYQGVDIWKYFYNQLSFELLPNYENKVLVLTDGYFDFENPNFVKKQDNFYTSTQFFAYLNTNDWKQISEERNYGLIPIEKDFANANVIVVGIKPKKNDLYEQEKLIYFWGKWIRSMDFKQVVCVPSASEVQLGQRIRRLL